MLTRRGIRLPFQKEPAISKPTAELTDVRQVILPFAYATEATVTPAVSLYDTVNKGTPLSVVEDDPIAAVCSGVVGVVSGERDIQHPLYGDLHCAVIDCMPISPTPEVPTPPQDLTAEHILSVAEAADIIDECDGIPLVLKLRSWQQQGCDVLVADGVEIEPFASCAWAVLRDHAEHVLEGLRLAASCVNAQQYHIAVCLSGSRRRSIALRIGKKHLYQTDSIYPKKESAVRFAPFDSAYTVKYNTRVCTIGVQACLALYRALFLSESHDRCTVTVAGDAVPNPQNVTVPFGTPVQEVLAFCGVSEPPDYLILGEQMRGVCALTSDIPILPGMTCILAFTSTAIRPVTPRTCTGCGRCVKVCHKGLMPFEINRRFNNLHYEHLRTLAVDSCDGCNACSFVCPCGIDLAGAVEQAKAVTDSILLNMEEDIDA